jgi:hypothetical protein
VAINKWLRTAETKQIEEVFHSRKQVGQALAKISRHNKITQHNHINIYYTAKNNKRIARFNVTQTMSQKRLKSLPGFESARNAFDNDDPLSRSMCPSTRVNAF